MPATAEALAVTERYQQTLSGLQGQAALQVRATWRDVRPDDLAATYEPWAQTTAAAVSAVQESGVALGTGYLAAYQSAETQEPPEPEPVDPRAYAGVTAAGAPLQDAILGTLYGVLERIADRDSSIALEAAVAAAIAWGFARNMRLAADAVAFAVRRPVADLIEQRPETFAGWRRVAKPSACAVCLAAATRDVYRVDELLRVHNHCACVQQPVIRGLSETVYQPTGNDIFRRLTPEQQDAAAGPGVANALRDGHVELADLIGTAPMEAQPDQLVQRPLEQLLATGQ